MTSGAFMDRINNNRSWTFEGLNLFKNATRNKIGANGFPPKLSFANGFVQCTLSRPMVDFMFYDINIEMLANELNINRFGVDEILMATLQTSDALAIPGGFTHHCLERDRGYDHIANHITRMSIWWEGDRSICPTKQFRHNLCIFGVEDLSRVLEFPHFFANKIMADFDFAALTCWYEKLFNLTHNIPQEPTRLNKMHYLNLLPMVYHDEKLRNGKVNLTAFSCRTRVDSWKKFRYNDTG